MTTTFEYKNSCLSVVEGAPEKPKCSNDNPEDCHSCNCDAKLKQYESALASCRRIPVADEDQEKVMLKLYINRPYKEEISFNKFKENLKEGELYNVDVETQSVTQYQHLDKWKDLGDSFSVCDELELERQGRLRVVARIKQPETVFNTGNVDPFIKGSDNPGYLTDLEEIKKHQIPTILPSINANNLLNEILEYAEINRHSFKNDFEYEKFKKYTQHLKQPVKPVVASTEGQEETEEDVKIRDYEHHYELHNPYRKPTVNADQLYEKVTARQDDSGHWYVIPDELNKRWNELEEIMAGESQLAFEKAEDEFISEFSQYMTGGDLNNVQLYTRNPKQP